MSLTRQLKDIKRGLLVSPLHEAYLERGGDVQLTPEVAQFVIDQLTSPQRDRSTTWSASGLGSCERQRVFGRVIPHKAAQHKFTSDTNNYFIHGTWTHLKWQTMGFDAGWLAQAEVPIEIPDLNLRGTIDGILTTGQGWELKSINERGFRMVASEGPLEKHVYQIHAYMLGSGINEWSLIYEDKGTQQWREYVISYDEQVGGEVHDELVRLNRSLQDRKLPPVLPKCALREGAEYKQCSFADTCLNTSAWPRAVRLRRGHHDPARVLTSGVPDDSHEPAGNTVALVADDA